MVILLKPAVCCVVLLRFGKKKCQNCTFLKSGKPLNQLIFYWMPKINGALIVRLGAESALLAPITSLRWTFAVEVDRCDFTPHEASQGYTLSTS